MTLEQAIAKLTALIAGGLTPSQAEKHLGIKRSTNLWRELAKARYWER